MTSLIRTLPPQRGPDAIGVFDAGESQRPATKWLTVGRPTTPMGVTMSRVGGGSYKSVTCLLNG